MKIFVFINKCYRLLKKYKLSFWIIFCLKVILIIISLAITFCISHVITLFAIKDIDNIKKYIYILLIIYIIYSICQYIQFNLTQIVEKNVRTETKKVILKRMMKSFFKSYREGKVINSAKVNEILYTDANNITTLLFTVLDVIITFFTIVITGILLFSINFYLSSILTIFFILDAVFIFGYSKKLKKINYKLREETDEHFRLIRDIIKNIKYICISDSCKFHYNKYTKNLDNVKKSTMYRDKKVWSFGYWNSIFECVWIITFFYFSVKELFKGSFNVAYFMLFFSYSRMYSNGINRLLSQYSNIQQIMVSMERLFELLEIYEIKEMSKHEFPVQVKNIIIKEIVFGYDKNNIILSLDKKIVKRSILITGKNGVGKTTLMNLLSGLLLSQNGNILYNNIPIEDISIESLYKSISYEIQGDLVFDMSIKDNILSFSKTDNITEEELNTICKQVGILKDILALEKKFDTQISEIRDFSFGQKKKILLARTFLKPSQIIFLDEPLEGLDIESQELVINYIKSIINKKYVFICTHKPEKFKFFEENITL